MNIKQLRDSFLYALSYAVGIAPAKDRIHPAFSSTGDEGWLYNRSGGVGLSPDMIVGAQKIVVFLGKNDLCKLDHCPFAAKIGLNDDPNLTEPYCLVIYPVDGSETIDDVAGWVAEEKFPKASVFTHGYHTPRGDWVAGRKLRTITPQ